MTMNRRGFDVRWVDPKTLAKGINKRNWRHHPERQKKAVRALIKRNGWARPLVWNEKTKRLIDGHCRLEIALEDNVSEVPVLFGSWTESQEKELLASLDTSGNMAQIDGKSLDSLCREIAKDVEGLVNKDPFAGEMMKMSIDLHGLAMDTKARTPLLKRLGAKKKIGKDKVTTPTVPKQAREPHKDIMGQRAIEDSVLYKSTNEWGIPDLLPSRCYSDLEALPDRTYDGVIDNHHTLSWYAWGFAPFKGKVDGGFVQFFTDDHRFARLYRYPSHYTEKFLAWNFHAAVEPDFSTYEDWPLVARLWSVYRSRWVANYLAVNCGCPCIPQIRSCADPSKSEWMYSILPKAPIMALNCAMRHANKTAKRYEAELGACVEAALSFRREIKVVILNGGLEKFNHLEGYLPKGPEYVPLEAWTTARRRVISTKG